jgi:SAM-dependent methyltransferase
VTGARPPAPPPASSLDNADATAIARAFLPASRWGNRSTYYYVRAKLGSDPLYSGVLQALPDDGLPLLDLGCGLGLLGHVMRRHGRPQPYLGVDLDASKIDRGERAVRRAALAALDLRPLDIQQPLPRHSGHVAVLDVLHYLDAHAQASLLQAAAERVAPGGTLVLRTPLDTGDGRDRTTRLADRLGWLSGWMRTRPRHYPSADALQQLLGRAGLVAAAPSPLHGRTPFNSWLLVATRPPAAG